MAARWLDAGDHRLYLEEQGPSGGPAVLLLHHGLGTERSWRWQIPFLARAGFHVVAYDRWGYGRSDPRPEGVLSYSMPDFADDQADLLTLLDQLQISRAALVGHSDGGTIALYIAARHPERVSALVTLAAHAYVEEKMIAGIQGVYRQYAADADFRARFVRRQGKNAQALINGWGAGWQREENLSWDIRPELGNIRCPALVIQGSEDEHGTPQHAREIAAAIPGAELVLLLDAGHMLPGDNKKQVSRLLCAFLKRVVTQEYADVQ